MARIEEPIIREARFEDRHAVLELQRSAGFAEGMQVDWDWLWSHNPARVDAGPEPVIGWVLEAQGRIVGYLGNLPSYYRYGDATLQAAIATGFAVDQAYRGFGLRLVGAFFRQEKADLLLNTTASQAASQIFQRFNAVPMPQSGFDQMIFWVLRPRAFAKAFLTRKRYPTVLACAGSYITGPLLQVDILKRRRRPEKYSAAALSTVEALCWQDIGDEFDQLWARKLNEGKRLLAYRDAASLRWRLSAPGPDVKTKILACRRDGRLAGYVLVVRDRLRHLDLERSRIIDLLVERDNSDIVDLLIGAAYGEARCDGSHMLEAIGLPNVIRQRLREANPYTRFIAQNTFIFKAADPQIQSELALCEAWYASGFDGDTGL